MFARPILAYDSKILFTDRVQLASMSRRCGNALASRDAGDTKDDGVLLERFGPIGAGPNMLGASH